MQFDLCDASEARVYCQMNQKGTCHKVKVPPRPQSLFVEQIQFVEVSCEISARIVDSYVRDREDASEIGIRCMKEVVVFFNEALESK